MRLRCIWCNQNTLNLKQRTQKKPTYLIKRNKINQWKRALHRSRSYWIVQFREIKILDISIAKCVNQYKNYVMSTFYIPICRCWDEIFYFLLFERTDDEKKKCKTYPQFCVWLHVETGMWWVSCWISCVTRSSCLPLLFNFVLTTRKPDLRHIAWLSICVCVYAACAYYKLLLFIILLMMS